MIQSIAIVHSELQQGLYRFLADFFRFAGILVCDYAVTDKTEFTEESLNYNFDAVFIDTTPSREDETGLNINQRVAAKNLFSNAQVIADVNQESLKWEKTEDAENSRKYCLTCIIGEFKTINDTEKDALKILADIYVEHYIMRNRIILQTFLHFPKFIENVRKELVDAYKALLTNDQYDKYNSNEHYWFAQRYVEWLINEACDFLGTDYIFDTKYIVDYILVYLSMETEQQDNKIYRRYLYDLIASFYECDRGYRKKSGSYYSKAAEIAKDTPFESYMRYRYGRALEKYEYNWPLAIIQYEKAKGAQSIDYKTEYKLAIYEWKERLNLKEAYKHFKRIDEILDNKRRHNVLQAIEAEYLYKAWHFIGEIIDEGNGEDFAAGLTVEKVDEELQNILETVSDKDKKNPNYMYVFSNISPNNDELYYRKMLARRVAEVCDLDRLLDKRAKNGSTLIS